MLTGFEQLCNRFKIVSIAPLLKGWSRDKKYILESSGEKDTFFGYRITIYMKKRRINSSFLKRSNFSDLTAPNLSNLALLQTVLFIYFCLIWKAKMGKLQCWI